MQANKDSARKCSLLWYYSIVPVGSSCVNRGFLCLVHTAASGLLVYKSVPIGNMSEVLPYLSRRAAENRAILKGARLEKRLVKEELQRRLFLRRRH